LEVFFFICDFSDAFSSTIASNARYEKLIKFAIIYSIAKFKFPSFS